jgi:RNA polymerase sigma-70 factor (ECF subfamily)
MTDLAKISDLDLMTEYINADRELALETIYHRYNETLRTMLRVKCSVPSGEEDDFLQMVWVKVLACFDTYDPTISTWSWLYKIASGVVNSDAVSKRCLKRAPSESAMSNDVAEDCSVFALETTEDLRLPKPTTDPAELLMVRDQLRMVLEAIEEMGQLQSDVIRYVCIEGLSYEEAAKILGLSRDALSATLHRVRDKLNRKKNLAA